MEIYKRQLIEKCDNPIVDGQFQFGCFRHPFEKTNFLDAKSPYLLPFNFVKRIQLREWQAFQISNQNYFIMIALYNAKKLSLVQFIVYDIKLQKKLRYEKKVPAWKINVPSKLYQSKAFYRSKNFTIEVDHDLSSNLLSIDVNIEKFQKLPSLKANFKGYHDVEKYQPSVVCLPFSKRRGMYSHKCLMPMEGNLQIDQRQIEFKQEESQLIIDDHKGYYPFPTRYDWLTGMQRLKNGSLIGFNLTNNQVEDQEKFNENCLWIDGKMHQLPPIRFDCPNGYKGVWKIKDKYGMVDLSFQPVIHNAVDVNLLLFRSKYQGPYGYINGFMKNTNGQKIEISNMFGMGEDFYLRI